MFCAESVANTKKHFRNNHRPLFRMYLKKHQIKVTTSRFSSLYYKPSSKYILNQIAQMLGILKQINTARVIRICLCQSTGPIIGIREPTPLSWHSKTPIVIPFVARNSLTCIQGIFDTCICMYLWLLGRPQIQNILPPPPPGGKYWCVHKYGS